MAVSNRAGSPVTNRAMIASLSMPITPSCGPGHADIGQARRAARQDAFVRGLHVRVRADHRRHFAIEVIAERDFLRRRLGVHVDEDHLRAVLA